MRLGQLTDMDREKLRADYDAVVALIEELTAFLADESLQYALIKQETQELKEKYGDPAGPRSYLLPMNSTPRISTPTRTWSSPFPTPAISSVPL